MRSLFILIIVTVYIHASMILNLNVKEHNNKVELLLNFDSPFTGTLIQKRTEDRIDILLKNVVLLTPWQKKLSSKIVYEVEAKPLKNATIVSFYTISSPKLFAARSKDGYSLKLLLQTQKSSKETKSETNKPSFFNASGLKKIGLYLVGIIFLISILILLSRLLSKKSSHVQETRRIIVENPQKEKFKILFEKPLDEKNKVALIEHNDIQYLVIIGSTNVLLGKYKAGEIESHEEFEKVITNQNLTEALKPQQQDDIFTTIEEYKRKASGNF